MLVVSFRSAIQKGTQCYEPFVQAKCGDKANKSLHGITDFIVAALNCKPNSC